MHRTTILLPRDLHRAAESEARTAGISFSELIRRRLATSRPQQPASPPAFFSRKPWVDSGPSDMAADHDRYLYGP